MFLFAFLTFNLMASTLGCKRIVCYYTNWSQYRPTPYKFVPEHIDTTLCTHINYAFAKIVNNRLAPYEYNDEEMYKKMVNRTALTNPAVKLLLSVGGWTMASGPFSSMVATASGREIFANDTLRFLRDIKFDGLDLDWEYPGTRGGSREKDKQNFVELLKVLTRVYDEEAKATGNTRLLLTAAVAAGKDNIDIGYNIPEISKYMDFINIMTYDIHGSWEWLTGHVSPLYARSDETWYQSYLNVNWTVNYWKNEGLPKEKLVIGLATYGRSFTLSSSSENGIKAKTRGPGTVGRYTRTRGFLSYFEVCAMIEDGASVYREPEQKVPFAVLGDQWVGYEDEQSIREKVKYMLSNEYGGVMIWSFDLDDFNGGTCGDGTTYPLIRAVADECAGNPNGVTFPTQAVQKQTTPATDVSTSTTRTNAGGAKVVTEFSCEGKASGLYPSPYSCEDYYTCSNGFLYQQSCHPGLVFNPDVSTCDWPRNYPCTVKQLSSTAATQSSTAAQVTPETSSTTPITTSTTDAPTTTTARTTSTNWTSPTTTSTANTTSSITNTTSSTASATTTITAAASTTTTAEAARSTTTKEITDQNIDCTKTAPGLYPSSSSCKEYVWCAGGLLYNKTCPLNLVFNPDKKYCDWIHNYDCPIDKANVKIVSTTVAPQSTTSDFMFDDTFCLHKEDGEYADPQSCSHYYLCLLKSSSRIKCPSGLAFHPTSGYCQFPHNVQGCS